MTLGEATGAARDVPELVKASRRRAVIRRMQRMPSRRRERDLLEPGEVFLHGWRDLGGEQ